MPVPRPVRADMHIIRIAFLHAFLAARLGPEGKPQLLLEGGRAFTYGQDSLRPVMARRTSHPVGCQKLK